MDKSFDINQDVQHNNSYLNTFRFSKDFGNLSNLKRGYKNRKNKKNKESKENKEDKEDKGKQDEKVEKKIKNHVDRNENHLGFCENRNEEINNYGSGFNSLKGASSNYENAYLVYLENRSSNSKSMQANPKMVEENLGRQLNWIFSFNEEKKVKYVLVNTSLRLRFFFLAYRKFGKMRERLRRRNIRRRVAKLIRQFMWKYFSVIKKFKRNNPAYVLRIVRTYTSENYDDLRQEVSMLARRKYKDPNLRKLHKREFLIMEPSFSRKFLRIKAEIKKRVLDKFRFIVKKDYKLFYLLFGARWRRKKDLARMRKLRLRLWKLRYGKNFSSNVLWYYFGVGRTTSFARRNYRDYGVPYRPSIYKMFVAFRDENGLFRYLVDKRFKFRIEKRRYKQASRFYRSIKVFSGLNKDKNDKLIVRFKSRSKIFGNQVKADNGLSVRFRRLKFLNANVKFNLKFGYKKVYFRKIVFIKKQGNSFLVYKSNELDKLCPISLSYKYKFGSGKDEKKKRRRV